MDAGLKSDCLKSEKKSLAPAPKTSRVGLGLFICKNLLNSMAEILVRKRSNEGSTFNVTIPL
jgi:K+-sensing histidine kinase KdpD